MIDTLQADVLVVGAGPVGLTLAVELTRRGVACCIIDQAASYPVGTRGAGINARTQEVFEDLGVLDHMIEYNEPIRATRFYGTDNQSIHESNQVWDPLPPPTPSEPYRKALLVGQQNTEAILRERLRESGVSVEMNCQLVALTQHADDVVATVKQDEQSIELRARYVVGCDGGHSAVRKFAGISFLGDTWDEEHFLLANLDVDGIDATVRHIWSSPEWGLISLSAMSKSNTWVFVATVKPDAQGALPTPTMENFEKLFDERVGIPGVHFSNPVWLSTWRPNIRMVDRYRNKRVFLAGDAAHVHSAAGGQGLNTGVQDAYNLGWKLAAVLSGAPEELLDTYQEERFPIAEWVLASTTKRHRKYLHGDFAESMSTLHSGKEAFTDTTGLSISYRGSRLSRDLDTATGVRAGDRAPDAPDLIDNKDEHVRLFDLFQGTHFTLLVFGQQPTLQLPGISNNDLHMYTIVHPSEEITPLPNGLIDSEGHAFRAYGINEKGMILVRPDGYIGLTSAHAEAAPVMDYLHDILGQ